MNRNAMLLSTFRPQFWPEAIGICYVTRSPTCSAMPGSSLHRFRRRGFDLALIRKTGLPYTMCRTMVQASTRLTLTGYLPLFSAYITRTIFPAPGLVFQPCSVLCNATVVRCGQRASPAGAQLFISPCTQTGPRTKLKTAAGRRYEIPLPLLDIPGQFHTPL
jgi:hypothetical protein